MNPRIVKEYQDDLFNFLKKEEGFKNVVYACSQHVPTIGVGYALAERSAVGFRPRAGLDHDFAKIAVCLTTADKNRLLKGLRHAQ